MRALAKLFLLPLAACAGAGVPDSFDVVILGGVLHDGSGADGRRADVGLRGDRVAAIGDLSGHPTQMCIDARGKIVCPGFIDLHNHSDQSILQDGLRENLCYLTQGCTTIVTGNCGGGQMRLDSYFGRLGKKGAGTNTAHLLPQGSIRRWAMGGSFDRAPTDEELARMKELVAKGMRAGAFGMTTGLIYTPGSFASTDEIAELAKVVGEHGGIYASHIRSEGDRLIPAVEEAIEIGRRAGCSVHISHFKASMPPNWGKVRQSCAVVERARAAGMRVTCDQYPYRASSTSLAALVMPTWAREGGNDDLLRRIADPEDGKRIKEAIRLAFEKRGGFDQILIARYRGNPAWNGLTVEAAARQAEMDPVELVCHMQKTGRVSAVAFSMCEEDVVYVMQRPYVATASDGSSKRPDKSRPHPRSYGTFPRKIGRFAIERRIVTLPRAIRSASGLPADVLGLEDRGYLRVGAFADVVVFDPGRLRDKATFSDPHQYSVGVEWVFVNGVPAIRAGVPTGALAGRPLRKAPPR